MNTFDRPHRVTQAHRNRSRIMAAIAVAGAAQHAQVAPAGDVGPRASRVVPYLVLIALQLFWVHYVRLGLKARGHTLTELTGGLWTSAFQLVSDLCVAVVAFVLARGAVELVKMAFGSVHSTTAFLLPHGVAESVVWVLVSIVAGFSEEVVFRGYLQRQFTALTGSAPLAILLQAIVFGISHGYQGPKSMVTTGAYGLVLGLVAWNRGNIRAGAIAHAATDIVGGLLR